MTDSLHTDPEQQLIERLRQEAAQRRPEFSEELHRRICRAVEQERAQPSRLRRRGWWADGRRWTILGAGAAVAAGIALLGAAMLLGWIDLDRPGAPEAPVPVVHNEPRVPVEPAPGPVERGPETVPPAEVPFLAEEAAARVGLLVDATLDNRQWAYLDHDLRLGAELLVDRLPWELVLAENAVPDEGPR